MSSGHSHLSHLERVDWSIIEYRQATERQLELVAQVADGGIDTIVFCTHPPVVTLGRGVKEGDVTGWSGELIESSRGGRATYHGPNQVVVYPIINLNSAGRKHLPPRDLHAYFKGLGQAAVEALKHFAIDAEVRLNSPTPETPSFTGVWVGERKVASIGVAVKKWVTYHGIAINLERDPQAFQGIRPCGFNRETMVSVEELIGRSPDRDQFKDIFFLKLTEQFS